MVVIGPYTAQGPNEAELVQIKKEIFTDHGYWLDISPQNILDIGAHVGLASLAFAHWYPQAQITAVEPHPISFGYLNINIDNNNLDSRINAINAAISTKATGFVQLHADPSEDEPWLSTASLHHSGWTGKEKTTQHQVPAIMLDDLIKAPIDLLKMDIEGIESKVLQSLKRIDMINNIICEFHPAANHQLNKIVAFLQTKGFAVFTNPINPKQDELSLITATRN